MRWLYGKGRTLVNLLLAALMVVLYIASTSPVAQSVMYELYNSPVYRGHQKGVVGIECAVSWNASALPALLELLKEKGTKITFLVSGEWAEENADLLRQMALDGHEIGTLGQDPGWDGNADEVAADIARAADTIESLTGVRPGLYHSGTRRVAASSRAAQMLRMTYVLCTVDLLSGRGDAKDILRRALDKPFDGSILLIQPTARAVQAMPEILDALTERGFRAATVSETFGEHIQKEVEA